MDLCMIFGKSLLIINSKTYVKNSNNGLAERAKRLQKLQLLVSNFLEIDWTLDNFFSASSMFLTTA